MYVNLFYLLIPLIRDIVKFNSPADNLLSTFFRNNRKLNNQERTIIADTAYTILRNYYKITVLVDNHIPHMIALCWLKLLSIPLKQFDSIKNFDLANLNVLEFASDDLSRLELPYSILDQLHHEYNPDEVEMIALSMQQQAPLDLRVNLIKNDVKNVLEQLNKEQLNPQQMEFSPFGIRLINKTFLARHPLFLNGSIEVQDQASQLAGILLNPKRGEMVADFCTGSGGKALLFGMLMKNSGRIYAFDNSEKRLNNLTPRLSRSGLSNIYPQLIAHENDNKIKRLHGKFDRVFIDAPCSGLGTLRRNPELKFRQTTATLTQINQQQLSIIHAASKLVKPGGHLVYATCSILCQENQNIVNLFLTNNSEFKLIPAQTILTNPKLLDAGGYLKLLPSKHNTDGFFAALFQRIK